MLLIFKHIMFLWLSNTTKFALNLAGLDYQKADIDLKIEDYCSGWLRLRMPGQRQKKVSECCWRVPSTTRRQVTRNTSNNDGDSALTIVPLCRGLSGTKITPGKWWKSRGQVGQTMDVYRRSYILLVSTPWLIPESSNMTQRVTRPVLLLVLLLWWVIKTHHKWLNDDASWLIPSTTRIHAYS